MFSPKQQLHSFAYNMYAVSLSSYFRFIFIFSRRLGLFTAQRQQKCLTKGMYLMHSHLVSKISLYHLFFSISSNIWRIVCDKRFNILLHTMLLMWHSIVIIQLCFSLTASSVLLKTNPAAFTLQHLQCCPPEVSILCSLFILFILTF